MFPDNLSHAGFVSGSFGYCNVVSRVNFPDNVIHVLVVHLVSC